MAVPNVNPGCPMNTQGVLRVNSLILDASLGFLWSSKWFAGLPRGDPGIPLSLQGFQGLICCINTVLSGFLVVHGVPGGDPRIPVSPLEYTGLFICIIRVFSGLLGIPSDVSRAFY